MALQVIGAGFGRTGTLSLKLALEALGIGRCYHMLEFRQCPAHVPLWRQVADGRQDLWDAIFDQYQASVDWPGCRFWRDLATYYPDAKVILTIRDPEHWYESIANTIYPWFIRGPDANDRPQDLERRAVTSKLIMQQTFDGRLGEREHAISVFERHNEQARHAIPPGRLLVYRVTDGRFAPSWDEPLPTPHSRTSIPPMTSEGASSLANPDPRSIPARSGQHASYHATRSARTSTIIRLCTCIPQVERI